MTLLEKIDLSNNRIENIEPLKYLNLVSELNLFIKHIDLSRNQIRNLTGLNNLKSLWILDLSNNEITSLDGIQNLASLQTLHLSNNKINQIEQINQLKQLNLLYIFNNPIRNLTFNIISKLKTQIYLSSSSFYNWSILNDSINRFKFLMILKIYLFNNNNVLKIKNYHLNLVIWLFITNRLI